MTKLFVYGSLRKGCFNHHYIEDIAQFKGMFYVKGNIFRAGLPADPQPGS